MGRRAALAAIPCRQRRHLHRHGRARVRPDPLAHRPGHRPPHRRLPSDQEAAQALATLSNGATALISLGRRYPLGDVCRVEVFGERDSQDCRFLWPPDADTVFLAGAASIRPKHSPAVTPGATAEDAIARSPAAEQARIRG